MGRNALIYEVAAATLDMSSELGNTLLLITALAATSAAVNLPSRAVGIDRMKTSGTGRPTLIPSSDAGLSASESVSGSLLCR